MAQVRNVTCLIDASALLAMLLGERGGGRLGDFLAGAALSTVNYHEVLVRLVDLEKRYGIDRTLAARGALPVAERSLALIDFDPAIARIATELRDPTRHLGLSLGDRACLATAIRLGCPVLTADGRMAEAEVGLDIRLIR